MKNRYTIVVLCLIFLDVVSQAQEVPMWVFPLYRELNFSKEFYLTGFAEENKVEKESVGKILDKVKNTAKKDLIQSLRSSIRIFSTNKVTEENTDGISEIKSVYQSFLEISSNSEIVNMKIESHYDENRNRGYAFAYVSKKELVDYYQSQSDLQLSRVGEILKSMEMMNYKRQKRKLCEMRDNALIGLAKAENALDLLSAVKGQNYKVFDSIKQILFKKSLAIDTIHIILHIDVVEYDLDRPSLFFFNSLTNILQRNDFHFTNNRDEADYSISIKINSKKMDDNVDNPNFKYVNIDAIMEILEIGTNRIIFNGGINELSLARSFENASRLGIEEASLSMWYKIKSLLELND